jgi:hypothetical protein
LGLRSRRFLDMLVPATSALVAISRFGTEGSMSPPSATMVAFMSVMLCRLTSPSAGLGPSGIELPTTAALMAPSPPSARASMVG